MRYCVLKGYRRCNGRESPVRWIAALLCLSMSSSMSLAHAGEIKDALGFGGDSGKIAKYAFKLRDSIYVTSLAWSPDGRYIATASTQSNLIHVWDVERRSISKEIKLNGSQTYFHGLSWSPDGKYLATCDDAIVQGKPRPFLRLIDAT